ncbi:hypothetical protein Rumeso_01841 [Rubellimicrobium mesophilum DSM 19309]|uniref:Uncharacterized protein n=1 Tax=Rubellimicrobium mesophilum DSM 19309 TaxID=442562 RepID=A0A017HQE1_9RHOB|nr:hypothetical protein Rumeso_01841 [Rubellimicrobium mesophilum DSM 19309]
MTVGNPGEFARRAVTAVGLQGECIDGHGVWPIFNRGALCREPLQRAWPFERLSTFKYIPDNVRSLYESL